MDQQMYQMHGLYLYIYIEHKSHEEMAGHLSACLVPSNVTLYRNLHVSPHGIVFLFTRHCVLDSTFTCSPTVSLSLSHQYYMSHLNYGPVFW